MPILAVEAVMYADLEQEFRPSKGNASLSVQDRLLASILPALHPDSWNALHPPAGR